LALLVSVFPSLPRRLSLLEMAKWARFSPPSLRPGDTPGGVAIPAEPARACDISADNAAIFRDQTSPAATRQGSKPGSKAWVKARIKSLGQSLVVAGNGLPANPSR